MQVIVRENAISTALLNFLLTLYIHNYIIFFRVLPDKIAIGSSIKIVI